MPISRMDEWIIGLVDYVRHAWKLGAQLSQEKFDETLMKMLTDGREGWDLKGVIYEGGLTPALYVHLWK